MTYSREIFFPQLFPAHVALSKQQLPNEVPGLKAVEREINALITERERIFAKKKCLPRNAQRKSRLNFIFDTRLEEIRSSLAALYARRKEMSATEKVGEDATS